METLRYLIVIFLTTTFNSGQTQDLISVANSFLNEKNYVAAKTSIDKVFLKPETRQNARAWYTKGRIYHEILKNNSPELRQFKNDTEQFVKQILEAYDKTQSLTGRGNNLFILAGNQKKYLWSESMNTGYDRYQEGSFKEAFNSFEIAQAIEPRDTTAFVYAAISAEKAGDYQLAIDNYLKIKKIKQLSISIYHSVIGYHYLKKSSIRTQLDFVEEAIYNYPNHVPFITIENKMLVSLGRFEAAESRLQTVIPRNPEAYDLRLVRADLYDRIFRNAYKNGLREKSDTYFDMAIDEYEVFLAAFPDHFTAHYNFAVMINEVANRLYTKANLYSQDEFEISGRETQEEGHKWTRKALPHMEKALELKPDDAGVVEALKAFYQRLKLNAKLALLNNK